MCKSTTEETKLFPRVCSQCGKGMDKGYLAYGHEYYCSNACLFTEFTPESWHILHESDGDNFYYTEWEELDEDENYDANGNLVIC